MFFISSPSPSRFVLHKLFGDTALVKVLEVLLQHALDESNQESLRWANFSMIAKEAGVAKSSSKRILDKLLFEEYIEEKMVETHAANPPRLVRLRGEQPIIRELLFFYRKARGFL